MQNKLPQRFREGTLDFQLGNLASNLSRLSSSAFSEERDETTIRMLIESKRFIEWIGPTLPHDKQLVMVEMQRQMAIWQLRLQNGKLAHHEREEISAFSKVSSETMLSWTELFV